MNAPVFVSILERSLVSFTKAVYPDGNRFVQDNDPKHCSNYAKGFYEDKGIYWWPTFPKSPDLNPPLKTLARADGVHTAIGEAQNKARDHHWNQNFLRDCNSREMSKIHALDT